MKQCLDCKTEFSPTGTNHKRCVPCGKAREKLKARENDRKLYLASKGKDKRFRKKYGIGVDEYNGMFAAQNGRCAICLTHQAELERALAVDHCHATGAVRGLLCMACNLLLGYAKDDSGKLLDAIKYLESSK